MDAGERDVVAVADGECAELRERLAEQHARKHRRAREVTRKVALVRADELHADRADAGLDLDDAVDEMQPEPARADARLGYELGARGYSPSPSPLPPPPPGFLMPLARARFGFALWSLITSSVMSMVLSL